MPKAREGIIPPSPVGLGGLPRESPINGFGHDLLLDFIWILAAHLSLVQRHKVRSLEAYDKVRAYFRTTTAKHFSAQAT